MNSSALDLLVDLVRFVGRLAWHGAILAFRLVAIAFDLMSTLIAAFGGTSTKQDCHSIVSGTVGYPGAKPVRPNWTADDLDSYGRPPF